MAQPSEIHPSRDEDENVLLIPPNSVQIPTMMAPPPPRNRVHPIPHGSPPSTSQFRVPARVPLNGSASPLRASFIAGPPPHLNGAHPRPPSISTPFSRPHSSPLSPSFPSSPSLSSPTSPRPSIMVTSHSAPDTSIDTASNHSRRHSRNLSVFFPRTGSLPTSTISEDGGQELELHPPSMTSFPSPPSPLGRGFTFGARPTNSAILTKTPGSGSSSSASRRGHHHKHSVSHNFFSFLEPGSENFHTEPALIPVSPWTPMPDSAGTATSPLSPVERPQQIPAQDGIPAIGAAASAAQFILGAYLWVCGQQIGSLSCTALGYWVVFDSFGLALSEVIPPWLASGSNRVRDRLRRPYGNGRLEIVLMFAQVVYLMFSSVYVCKETVEHLLLSGGGEGHHHHHGDEEGVAEGIHFPVIMTFVAFPSIVAIALVFDNNTKLVNITGNRIPSLSTIIRSITSPSKHAYHSPPPTTPLAIMLSNPYIACPLAFCTSIFLIGLLLPATHHRTADLVLAMLIAVLTFKVAYCASVVLGTVLLQTSPPRGMESGKMESSYEPCVRLRDIHKSCTSPHRISGNSLRACKK